ncbi:MAG: hypothetical protein E4H14_13670 [Candidatus Thorarchaeota archaeon]|nr:MAG: hypothetical protein E4H14_13670 [Candidatus Thorarchaeota archaeon]
MKVQYMKWESGKGLEEIQATIYTEVSGLPERAEQIAPRNDDRGNDATRYAITEDGKPLAYVTSATDDDEPWRGFIGYPWSLKDCPVEVKDKIFNDLMDHIYSKDGINQIRTAVVIGSKTKEEQIKYFKEKGFVETERYYTYNKDLDIEKSAAIDVNKKFERKEAELSSRVATEKDISALVELCQADLHLRRAFPDEEAFTNYFKDRVLKDGHCVMLFDGDMLVTASAPFRFSPDGNILKGDEDRYIMRFTATKPGYEYSWNRLAVEVAKECKAAGMTDLPLRTWFGFRAEGAAAIGLAKMNPDIELNEIFFTHRKEMK